MLVCISIISEPCASVCSLAVASALMHAHVQADVQVCCVHLHSARVIFKRLVLQLTGLALDIGTLGYDAYTHPFSTRVQIRIQSAAQAPTP